ncbi:MAG: zinc-ribbon domain-containing protein, partial [Candidatus Lokiarchaeota archaeon]|nr:zinc-ribbon domain-containing protein [Candidatus Lokiarchaeota archaeon]
MSDSESQDQKKTKKCPACGKELPSNARFCQKCGNNLTKEINTEWRTATIKKRGQAGKKETDKTDDLEPITQKCPFCGVIIKSTVLDQCPECFHMLSELPAGYKENLDKKFLTPNQRKKETQKVKKKDKWNIQEAFSVFFNSILVFIVSEFLVMMVFIVMNPELMDSPGTATIPVNNLSIILNSIPSVLLGLYPLIYIKKNQHAFKKLGLIRQDLLKYIIYG